MTDLATTGEAAKRYTNLEIVREPFLDRARAASELTIPSLIPPDGHTSHSDLPTTFQSVGAKGVNNLSSKMALTAMPPNAPFFRVGIDPKVQRELEDDPAFKEEVKKALAIYERTVMSEIEASGERPVINEVMKHLIVAGNVLLYLSKDGAQVFHLDRYVVVRDAMGRPIEIVVKETFSYATLSEVARELVAQPPTTAPGGSHQVEKPYHVYTHVVRKKKQWFSYQEIDGKRIPGSDGQYPLDKSPWLPLRFIQISGEDYGRGHVEEYLGDLKSLEALTEAIVMGAAAAAKVLFLVRPNGTTEVRTISESETGDIREGNAEDVTVLQMDKFADFRIAFETMNRIERRLQEAFLLNSSIQRDAERVTAEEIRFMAQDLEDALGGVYSTMSQEFQHPYVTRKIHLLQRSGTLKRLPNGVARIVITTGLEALGRGHELSKLDAFVDRVNRLFGTGAAEKYLDASVAIERLAAGDGIDTEGLVKDQDALEADNQQAQAQELAQAATPEAVKQIGGAMAQQQQQQQQQTPVEGA